jgi:DNA-binding response OmpR family regulator
VARRAVEPDALLAAALEVVAEAADVLYRSAGDGAVVRRALAAAQRSLGAIARDGGGVRDAAAARAALAAGRAALAAGEIALARSAANRLYEWAACALEPSSSREMTRLRLALLLLRDAELGIAEAGCSGAARPLLFCRAVWRSLGDDRRAAAAAPACSAFEALLAAAQRALDDLDRAALRGAVAEALARFEAVEAVFAAASRARVGLAVEAGAITRKRMAVLVVEDELRVRSFIERGLSEEGLTVVSAGEAAAAERTLAAGGVDLVLLDWMLPGDSGLELLRRWRGRGDVTPIIMLTARDALEDRVAALDAGADDYVVKPFAFEELLARVRAVLRRAAGRPSPVLACGDLVLDPAAHRVTRRGVPVRLTPREFALLQFLMQHAGETLSRTRIAAAVWEHDFDTFSNVVEVYIRYLRAKIDEPFGVPLIHTVRGVGYMLKDQP